MIKQIRYFQAVVRCKSFTEAAELLMSGKRAFITGSTLLIDGGATASYFYGPLARER